MSTLDYRAWDGETMWYTDGRHSAKIEIGGDAQSAVMNGWSQGGEWLFKVDAKEFMQFIGIRDRNREKLYVGDIVIGHRGRVISDGYTKKKYPKTIRVYLLISFSDGKGIEPGFYLSEIGIHSQDREAEEKYQYRSISYRLEESREFHLINNEIVWKGYADSLEKIGNKYEIDDPFKNELPNIKELVK